MNKIIIDRSDLDQEVAFRPASDGQPSKSITRREELENPKYFMLRADILLFNGRTMQSALYAGTDAKKDHGFYGDLWLLEILTPTEYAELRAIAHRMRANAKALPTCR